MWCFITRRLVRLCAVRNMPFRYVMFCHVLLSDYICRFAWFTSRRFVMFYHVLLFCLYVMIYHILFRARTWRFITCCPAFECADLAHIVFPYMWRFVTYCSKFACGVLSRLVSCPPLAFIVSFCAHTWCFITYWSVLVCGVLTQFALILICDVSSHIVLRSHMMFYPVFVFLLYVTFCHIFAFLLYVTFYHILPRVLLFRFSFFSWYVMIYYIPSRAMLSIFVIYCSVLMRGVLSHIFFPSRSRG